MRVMGCFIQLLTSRFRGMLYFYSLCGGICSYKDYSMRAMRCFIQQLTLRFRVISQSAQKLVYFLLLFALQ